MRFGLARTISEHCGCVSGQADRRHEPRRKFVCLHDSLPSGPQHLTCRVQICLCCRTLTGNRYLARNTVMNPAESEVASTTHCSQLGLTDWKTLGKLDLSGARQASRMSFPPM